LENLHNPFIICNRLYLRALEKKDLEGNWFRWFNDPHNTRFTGHGRFPNTIEKQTQYFETITNSKNDLVLAIIDKSSNNHIGVIALNNIQWIHQNADLNIIMGDYDIKYIGYGFEASCFLIDHGFQRLNLHKICEGHDIGLKGWGNLLKKIGFKIYGVQKEHMFRDGKFFDIERSEVFPKDFYKSATTKKFIKNIPEHYLNSD